MNSYNKYGPALLRKCERMLGNAYDAEDVVQSLFVDLLRKKKTEVDLPYLYRAVTNRCITILRKRKNHRRLLENQQEALHAPPRTMLDNRTISLDLLTKLAKKLDKKSLEILVYRYLDDLNLEEIARLTALSRPTIHKRLLKVRQVAEFLAQEAENGGQQ
ncbi:MAG: sigma-70 family RNA polymerase sigma factor [Deltaproteobacteria bacterium]|nr:sigma-70 family RNA polymerase sigma factor [Deltaproteobacteria bacterium]